MINMLDNAKSVSDLRAIACEITGKSDSLSCLNRQLMGNQIVLSFDDKLSKEELNEYSRNSDAIVSFLKKSEEFPSSKKILNRLQIAAKINPNIVKKVDLFLAKSCL